MSDVMQRLKEDTWDLHQAAERQAFQQRMVAGRISRNEYAGWLAQMYILHGALEEPLAQLAESDPRFAAVKPRQFQVSYLATDLEALGVDPASIEALPATAALAARILAAPEEEPLRLLGYHYVLEGSNNGNRFIARRLLPALGINGDAGGRYLDPYGDEQRQLWQTFRADMGEIDFSDDEVETLVAAARHLFQAITDLSAQLATAPVA